MKSKEEILKRNVEAIAKCKVKYNLTHQGILNAMEEYASQCQEDMTDTSKVTRFEVIDENGRAYTQKDCNVELSYQDDSRTLKVFIKLNKQDLPIINGSYGCTIETSKNKQD